MTFGAGGVAHASSAGNISETTREPSVRPTVALLGSEYEENLSLRYLAAAVAQDGVDSVIIPFHDVAAIGRIVGEIRAVAPLVVGISVPFQLRAREFFQLAQALRDEGCTAHITAGGHFATFEYENILRDFPAVDSVVRHEGEQTFRELVQRVSRGEPITGLPGTVTRGPEGIVDAGKRRLPPLDDLPFPDRRGSPYDVMGVRAAPIIGSRGCYADCSFCCIYAYAENADGARYRRRSPENIALEMYQEYSQRGVRLFVFNDDNFFVPSARQNIERYTRLKELLEQYGMTDIGLVIKCRPNDVNAELFRLLQSMGCVRAYVGIETNSDEGIVSLNRRITSADNRRALRVFRELGVYHSYNVLIFDPEATLDGVARNLDFMEEFSDVPFNFCRAEVYAGTPLKAMLEGQRRLRGDYFAWSYEMRAPRVELLFRIAATAFAARNFRHDGVANLNLGIRFDNVVMHHFFPECWDTSWEAELVDFSRRVGHDSVACMRDALRFASDADVYDHAAVKTFALDLARRVSAHDLQFIGECKRLRREMERRILERGRSRLATTFGAGMPVWAAESLRLSSSTGSELSTEALPTPAGV